jgi:HEAT repeat protein
MPHIACFVAHNLPGGTPTPSPWRFDPTSALIGAAVALLLAWLTFHFRDVLRVGWQTVTAPLAQALHRFQASAEDRYRERVAEWARSLAVLRHVAPLDTVFVEPELCPPRPLPQSISEIESSPAGTLTLPLRRTLGQHTQLVILGPPGAGRTALMAHVALTCAARARDGMEPLGLAQEHLPLYIQMPTVDWPEMNSEDEPADRQVSEGIEQIAGAAVATIGGGGGMMKPVRQYLEVGRAIVLADGWDALDPQQRQRATACLSTLTRDLPGNIWLVSTGVRGYAPWTEAGFVPLTLVPWKAAQVDAFVRQWIAAYTPDGESPPFPPHEMTTQLRRAIQEDASPLELALRAFVCLSDGHAPGRRAALFDRALDLLLWHDDEPWFPAACRAALGQVALSLQQEGRGAANRKDIETAIEAALPPVEERPARAAADVLHTLTGERGLLRPAGSTPYKGKRSGSNPYKGKRSGSNCYTFAHPLWQAYLAARQLIATNPAALIERLDDERWSEVLRFYAEIGDMGPLVAAWLSGPDDIFHTRLHTLSAWIGVAPQDATWRDGAMAVLARAFLQPGQPAQTRQALAKALAATGMQGTIYFFKQALKHPNAEVRVAAALGLIGTASDADMALLEAMLQDRSSTVREAAVRQLSRLETDAARRLLARVLLEGNDELRPAAAEALATWGEEGLGLLREAALAEDVVARRAAIFGLARLEARDLLEEVVREDEQWIVRSAAMGALDEMDEQEKIAGVAPLPQADQLPWLISWAAARGQAVGLGEAARPVLRRALSEGGVPIRLATAQALAQIGSPDDVEPLQSALSDPDPAVIGAAWEALDQINRRYDLLIT